MINKITFTCVCNILNKYVLSIFFTILLSLNSFTQSNTVTYFEDFNGIGYPTNIPSHVYWMYPNEIYPDQDTRGKFILGDGNAQVTADTDVDNDTDWKHPF